MKKFLTRCVADAHNQFMTFTLNTANLKREDEIGFAFLVAEDEEGHYEPVEMVCTLNEAQEIAEGDPQHPLHRR